MKKIKVLNVFALLFNLVIIVTVVMGGFVVNNDILGSLKYFTVLSNYLMALAALIAIPFNIRAIATGKGYPKAVFVLKLVATMSLALTFLTVCFFLAPQNGWNFVEQFGNFSFQRIEFFLHLIAPVSAIISFLFFDTCAKKTKFIVNLLSIVPGLLYGGFYIINYFAGWFIAEGIGTDWYGFIAVGGSPLFGALIFAAILVALFLLSFVFWLINRGVTSVKEEKEEGKIEKIDVAEVHEEPEEESSPVVEEKEEEESKEEAAPVEEKEELPKEETPKEEKKPAAKKETKKAESKPETKKEEKKETAKKVEPKKEEKPSEEKPAAKKEERTKVYHLTKRKEDGMWAITFVGGSKAVKLFRTKKEAEAALEVLTKNQGATALIRNSKGAKAGKFASSIKSSDDKEGK